MLSGAACGAGKQTRGFAINTAAHWGFGLPAALLLGFGLKLGVEGLYGGVILGPAVQWASYAWLLLHLNWPAEAAATHARMLALTESTAGAGI